MQGRVCVCVWFLCRVYNSGGQAEKYDIKIRIEVGEQAK